MCLDNYVDDVGNSMDFLPYYTHDDANNVIYVNKYSFTHIAFNFDCDNVKWRAIKHLFDLNFEIL